MITTAELLGGKIIFLGATCTTDFMVRFGVRLTKYSLKGVLITLVAAFQDPDTMISMAVRA